MVYMSYSRVFKSISVFFLVIKKHVNFALANENWESMKWLMDPVIFFTSAAHKSA